MCLNLFTESPFCPQTENLGQSNEESEQFTGSGVPHGNMYIHCYRKTYHSNKENRDSKTKKNILSKYYNKNDKTQNKTRCWK